MCVVNVRRHFTVNCWRFLTTVRIIDMINSRTHPPITAQKLKVFVERVECSRRYLGMIVKTTQQTLLTPTVPRLGEQYAKEWEISSPQTRLGAGLQPYARLAVSRTTAKVSLCRCVDVAVRSSCELIGPYKCVAVWPAPKLDTIPVDCR